MISDRHAWVAGRAHAIWVYEGRPDGRALAHWLQAEEELCEAERAAPPEPPPRPKRRVGKRATVSRYELPMATPTAKTSRPPTTT
jgi:hypothetical protein